MIDNHSVETATIVRVPVVSPDGGAAWRALYEGEVSEAEPVEDAEPDAE